MDPTEAGSDALGFGIEVVFPASGKAAPCCPHGPALLFQKVSRGGETPRRFYACSACRDRKDCSFFQWEEEKVSEERLKAREEQNQLERSGLKQQLLQHHQRFDKHANTFCHDCQLLLLPHELLAHAAHRRATVDAAQLRRPSTLLRPLDNKKKCAQFLFAERSAHFLLDTLAALGYNKVVCVGTPRLQELIKLRNLEENQQPSIRSLLLDIDLRYAQFYGPQDFCPYNMFNHHLFDGESSRATLEAFLTESPGERTAMVADPPFGGLVRPLAHSFSLLSKTWQRLQTPERTGSTLPMIWIFPYFFESRILECFPSFTMLDYQVDYDNHPLYKHGKTGRKISPVRLFTNIPASDFVLPKAEGYRLCVVCDRYVCSLNKHCKKCNTCPSKDGREWRHCSSCGKCVKPSWKHCTSCQRCCLPDHPCSPSSATDGCFICGNVKHRRISCPLRNRGRQVKGDGGRRTLVSRVQPKKKPKGKCTPSQSA